MRRKRGPPSKIDVSFAFQGLDRALHECFGRRQFDERDEEEVLTFLGHRCVYCDAEPIQRWDHLVAVTRGGETVIGNLVPACSTCDDSKGASNFADWMKGKAKNSPRSRGVGELDERIEKLRRYQERHSYVVVPLEQRLNHVELEAFAAIKAKIAEVRENFDRLSKAWAAREQPRKSAQARRKSKTMPKSNAGTTSPGYENRRQQRVIRNTGLPGNDHVQSIYELECLKCGHRYGANGSDIFQRRCPRCDGGKPGLPTS